MTNRFVAMVASPAGLTALSGEVAFGVEHAGQLVCEARRLAPGSEPAIWCAGLDLPALLTAATDIGWQLSEWGVSAVLEDAEGRASLTPINGPPLAGLTPQRILGVLQALEAAVGFTWTLSGASTLRNLLRSTQEGRKPIGVPYAPPDLTPAWVTPAWSIPAHRWETPEPRGGWRRPFDRNGAYLAAAGGLSVPDGPWQRGWMALEPGSESSRPVGYWLLDRAELAALIDPLLPNPFDRRTTEPAAWYTTPLAQLAADLAAETGATLTVHEVWWADGRRRPFNGLVDRVRAARDRITDPVALEVLKQGYSQLIADLEYGPKPGHKMWRPEWRRAVLDRHAANTYRAIARIAACPLELAHIDHVVYPLAGPDETPPGMRLGSGIGQWKPAGPAEQAA